MTLGTIIAGIIVLVVVALIVISLVKRKKAGKSLHCYGADCGSCGGICSSCRKKGQCQ